MSSTQRMSSRLREAASLLNPLFKPLPAFGEVVPRTRHAIGQRGVALQ